MTANHVDDLRTAMDAVRWNMNADEVEQESFRRIAAMVPELCASLPEPEWKVARRLIHATGDPKIAEQLVFTSHPIQAGVAALRRTAPIFCDTNMVRCGLSLPRLRLASHEYGPEQIYCYMADEDVQTQSLTSGHTRAICAVEKARPLLDGAIVLIGNAPLALARVARFCLEDGVKPALVVGMPVGFVNVVESKSLLTLCPVPSIVLQGRRGGSTLAVAALHAVVENL